MKLYSVARYRQQMYGDCPVVLPARNQRAATALARLLLGPGTWRATGPLDGPTMVDGAVRARLRGPTRFTDVAQEFDRLWAIWETLR